MKNKTNHILLDSNYLKALLISSAQYEVREYLKGISFKSINGKVWAISTNGHCVGRWLVTSDYEGADFEYIISRKAIKQAITWGDDIHLDALNGNIISNGLELSDILDSKTRDGRSFPTKALRMINKHLSAKNDDKANPKFQAECLRDLAKIGRLLAFSKIKRPVYPPVFSHIVKQKSGGNVFVIDGIDDYVHIIMPLKDWQGKEKDLVNQALQSAVMIAEVSSEVQDD